MKNVGLFFLSSLIFFLSRINILFNEYVISNDSSQHHFWMHKFNGEFFKGGDIIAQFAEIIQPKAYTFIYRVLLNFFELKYSILIIEYLIFILTSFLVLDICKRFFQKQTLFAFLLIIVSLSIPDVVGGFSRSFSFLIVIAPIYCLKFKYDHLIIGVVLFLSAFLYPVSFLISTGTILSLYGLNFILSKEPRFLIKVSLCLAFSLSAVILLKVKSDNFTNLNYVGPVITEEDINQNPIMGKEGRVHLKPQFEKSAFRLIGGQISKATSSFLQIPDLFKIINISIVFILGLIPLFLWSKILYSKKKIDDLSKVIISLLLTGIILFFLARILPFKLYMPLRYLEKTFPICLTLIALFVTNYFSIKKQKVYLLSSSLIVILVIAAIFNNNFQGFNDYSEYEFLYKEIKKTNKKSLIIAPPKVSDMIPFFSKRSVLVSEESCHGVYYQYYREDQMAKMTDLIKIYAEADIGEIKKILLKYDVNYLVLDKKFIPQNTTEEIDLFAPYSNIIENLITNKTIKQSFFLNASKSELPIYAENARFTIINCEKLISHSTFIP